MNSDKLLFSFNLFSHHAFKITGNESKPSIGSLSIGSLPSEFGVEETDE